MHETWIDQSPRQAYRELFGAAQEAYNQRQIAAGRPGRCIKSYYDQVAKDGQKHAVYEMIIAVGNRDNRPAEDLAKGILREFVDTWSERNDSLKMIGAYYHADEQGVPHVHIDYVPVAVGCRRGMAVQNGLVKALNAIGFETKSMSDTAQIQWEHRENQYLERLCAERGLEVDHPLDGRKHLKTERYKLEAELKKTEKKLEGLEAKRNELETERNELEAECDELEVKRDVLAANVEKMHQSGREKYAEYETKIVAKKQQIEALERQIEAFEHHIDNQRRIYEIFGGDPADLVAPERQDRTDVDLDNHDR